MNRTRTSALDSFRMVDLPVRVGLQRSVSTETRTTRLVPGSEILYKKFRDCETRRHGAGCHGLIHAITVTYFFGAAGAPWLACDWRNFWVCATVLVISATCSLASAMSLGSAC